MRKVSIQRGGGAPDTHVQGSNITIKQAVQCTWLAAFSLAREETRETCQDLKFCFYELDLGKIGGVKC